jgi:predicted permease
MNAMFSRNVLYGLRQLGRNRVFAVVAILTLALGIGMTASMFSVVYAVLMRPLPFTNAEQVVLIGQASPDNRPGVSSLPDIRDWREQSKSFNDIAYWELVVQNLESGGQMRSVPAIRCSANLFSLLGTRAALGRTFFPTEDKPENTVAVLSAAVWKSVFSSDPGVINSSVKLGDQFYTVIGVMPDDFIFPLTQSGPLVWVPGPPKPAWEDRNVAMLQAVGRLNANVSIATAENELAAITGRTTNNNTPTPRVLVKDYRESLTGNVRRMLLLLEAAVLLVWLVACINVVGILLARATSRSRETAIRCALGAGRGQLLNQFFAESAVLAGIAAAVGLLLCFISTRIIRSYLGSQLPFADSIAVNLPVLGLILLMSLASTLVFGMWPALISFRASPQDALREGTSGSGIGRRQRRVKDVLVICEVALSLVLLLNAGLLLRTIYNLRNTPLGFVPAQLVVGQLTAPQENQMPGEAVQSVHKSLLEELQRTPGVEHAAIATILPMNPNISAKFPVRIFGRTGQKDKSATADLRIVSPDIYNTLGTRLVKGRLFNDTDVKNAPWAVIVNQSFVKKYFPDEDPLGKQIRTAQDGPHKYSAIVGVVEDARGKSLADGVEPAMDICYAQLGPEDDFTMMMGFAIQVAVRTKQDPETVVPVVRRMLQHASPGGIFTVSTMQDKVDESLAGQRLIAQVIWMFAGVALLIALIGLYGSLSYNVSALRREIAVRLALGAPRGRVLGMIIRHALIVVGLGVGLGLFVWHRTVDLLKHYLHGVGTHDPLTIVSVIAMLTACGVLAGYLPARRASLVDPTKTLRHD